MEEESIRKRILQQIAQDRVERSERFGQPSAQNAQPASSTPKPASAQKLETARFARIQFKKPDGDTEMHTFNSIDTFQILRNYVQESVLAGLAIEKFTLATSFPRKEFTDDDNIKTLLELDLSPTAVILIIPSDRYSKYTKDKAVDRIRPFELLKNGFWSLTMPLFGLFNFIKSLVFRQNRPPNAGQNGAGQNNDGISPNDA